MTSPLSVLANTRDPAVVDLLNDAQIIALAGMLRPKLNKYIPHTPTLRQKQFLLLDCEEAGYGGAAGGGKSDVLLMGALQHVDVPGYAALLLRRTYADLEKPGALIPRSHQWLRNTDAHWNGQKRQWNFPSGAVLDFGYLDNEKDLDNYQSSEYQYVGFDELTQFEDENWYTYLFTRTRRLLSMGVPLRMRFATNPGGRGEDWVYNRFLAAGLDYGRVFIHAKLEDNPHIDQESYDKNLRKAAPTTYQQLRNGVWGVKKPGTFFRKNWFKIVGALPSNIQLIRSWDLAATKNATSAWTAGALMGQSDGDLYIAHMERLRGDPGEVERQVKQTANTDGFGVEIHIEQEGGSGGPNTLYRYQHLLFGYAVYPFHPKEDKTTRANPVSAAARAGNVYLLSGAWIGEFLKEYEAFPNGFKDQVDCVSAGYKVLSTQVEANIRKLR